MSNSMNPYLAAMYNTNGAGEQMTEEMQKNANAELFCKLAADQGLDLSQMSDEQVASVYAQVFPEEVAKLAAEEKEKEEGKAHEEKESKEHEEGEKEEEKEEAKKAEAAAYLAEKNAFVEKCAEADYMGRIMAHAFTQERANIEKLAADKKPEEGHHLRRAILGNPISGAIEAEKGKKLKTFGKAYGHALKETGKGALVGGAGGAALGAAIGAAKGGKAGALKGALGGGVSGLHVGALAGSVKGQHDRRASEIHGEHSKHKTKEGSAEAFEELAAEHAIKVAEAAGYDIDQAAERISAVYALGLTESEKIAHVNDIDTATHVRALEYLEAASYPVNWEEVFGS